MRNPKETEWWGLTEVAGVAGLTPWHCDRNRGSLPNCAAQQCSRRAEQAQDACEICSTSEGAAGNARDPKKGRFGHWVWAWTRVEGGFTAWPSSKQLTGGRSKPNKPLLCWSSQGDPARPGRPGPTLHLASAHRLGGLARHLLPLWGPCDCVLNSRVGQTRCRSTS